MEAADLPRVRLHEAIERLSSMPAFLQAALDAAERDELVLRPGQGEFSLAEHACHLRDLEREGFLVRLRRVLAEDVPVLEPFEGDRVARERNYIAQDARAAARDFAAARHQVVALATSLTGAQLQREAVFEGRRITLAEVIAMIVEHDRGHREDIEALAQALEAP